MSNEKAPKTPNAPGRWRIDWNNTPGEPWRTYTVNVFEERGVLMFFLPSANFASKCSLFNTWQGQEVKP